MEAFQAQRAAVAGVEYHMIVGAVHTGFKL